MKNKAAIILFLSSLFIFISIQVFSKGVYRKGNDTHYFEINDDNTYKYKYVIDTFIDVVSEGTWKKGKKNMILLTSEKEAKRLPIKFTRRKTPGSKTLRQLYVEFETSNGKIENYKVTPLTNRSIFPGYGDERGNQMFETAFYVDSVFFVIKKDDKTNPRPQPKEHYKKKSRPPHYTNIITETIGVKLNPGESAYIAIEIDDNDFIYRTFKNYPIELKGNKLIFKDSDDNRTYELEKQK